MDNKKGYLVALAILIVLGGLCFYQYQVWTQTILVAPEDVGKDYIGQVLSSYTFDRLFLQTEGSAPLLKYFTIGLFWIWFMYLLPNALETLRGKPTSKFWESLSWTNLPWAIAATFIVVIAWGIGAAAQHYQWYACFPVTIDGIVHQCFQGEQGTMDAVTHFWTPAAVIAITSTVNFMDILKLKGRNGRLLDLAIQGLLLILVAITFENVESGNPSIYKNTISNSEKDIAMGIVGGVMTLLGYNLAVPFKEAE